MGGRVSRVPQSKAQSKELVRAKVLRQALEQGAAPAFIPPAIPNPAAPDFATQASSLCWAPQEINAAANGTRPSAEETVEVHHQYLEQLFQSSPQPLIVVDGSFRTLCVNEEFQRAFGYSAEHILGQPIDTFLLAPDRAAESQWIRQCLQRGERITLETQRRCKDGTILDVSIFSAPLIVNGKVAAFYAVYRDISEQKRSEILSSALYRIAEKAGAEQDLQQLFASIHGIVDELMCAHNFSIAIHDAESDMLSYPYFVDEREAAPAPAKPGFGLTEYVLRTGLPLLCGAEVMQQLQKSGDVKLAGALPLQWLGVPLKANGHILGALVLKGYSRKVLFGEREREILTLVSQQLAAAIDRKRNEEELRRSEVRYRSLVQSAVYGIYRSNLDGRFLDVNPALMEMLGYSSALEVLALDPQKDVFVEAREYARLVDEFRRTGGMDGFEACWRRKDGSSITVRISGRAVANGDQPCDVLEAIAEDITERRVLEDQFRQAQKMEAVGRLAGGIAHDFNNLLVVISGYTEVLLDQLAPENPLHAKAESIQQASDRASALTRQLLAFSRKQHLELKVTDINTVVGNIERLLRPLIGEDVELSTHLEAGVGCTRADAGQLEQVIMNLVVNAKDAMPGGGKLTIRTASVTVDDTHGPEHTFIKRGAYVSIALSDTGEGMDRETQARIFEPFFTTKEKGKGTGLGLSTVYGIVKQSGGYVFVQSEPGRGSTFTIYFPKVDEPCDAVRATPASLTATGGSETILLVEDEESVRQLVRETLVARGYHVLEASNGNAALALAAGRADAIDLVITDVVMPGLSGHEMAQQLTQERPGLKILYLSGYAEDAFARPPASQGKKAFLQKPFTLQNLSRKVREVLGPAE